MQQTPSNNNQMRTAAIVTIVVIVGLLLVGRFLTSMNDDGENTTDRTTITDQTRENTPLLPQTNDTTRNTTNSTRNLGDVLVSQSVDRDNCAVEQTTRFDDNDSIYVVLEDSQIPEGTRLFARLYEDGRAIEDTRELVAEQDYNNVCVSFVFESAAGWDSGDYEVEFYVNGSPYRATAFQVR